jgi:isopenicillin-N N-acyltransferase-like protein
MSIDANETFPFIQFNGETSRERGYEHGTILSERIDKSIKLYREQFSKQKNFNEKYILNLCEQYRRGISLFSTDYLEELDSIAVSSKQDPLWIIALNCRLEILNHLAFGIQNECTVLYDKRTYELAENWDWIQDFEQLAFINYIKFNEILQMIEPGVLGKVGLNSYGIGVTINFVDPSIQSKNPSNIPLHISLRTVLDQAKTFEQALDIFEQNGPGFGGHVLVGKLLKNNFFFNKNFSFFQVMIKVNVVV